MPAGNSYPAPTLPLNGTEQFTLFQQQGAVVATCTATISQLVVSISANSFSSPPPIGSVTPNTGQFTYLSVVDFLNTSTATGIVAAGTSQATATAITAQINVISSVSAGTGIILPTVSTGTPVTVFHRATGGHTLSVYPPVGQQIEGLGTNAPSGMIQNGSNDFVYVGGNTWRVK